MTDEPASVTLPKWFLWVVSAVSTVFLVLFIPWGAWLTSSVMVILVRIDQTSINSAEIRRLEDHDNQLDLRVERIDARLKAAESDLASRNNLRWNKPDQIEFERRLDARLEGIERQWHEVESRVRGGE